MGLRFVKQLKMRYISVLVALGLLAAASYLLLDSIIVSQYAGILEINVAGRQRMLSQRIVLLSSQLNIVEDDKLRSVALKRLEQAIELMRQSHLALIRGDTKMGLSPPVSEKLKALYFGPTAFIDAEVQAFLAVAKEHVQVSAAGRDSGKDWHIFGNFNLKRLLNNLDSVVTQYQIELEFKIARLEVYQTLTFIVTLVLLGGSGLLVFQPMVARIQIYISKLAGAEGRLRGAIESLQEGFILCDADDRLVMINDVFRRINPQAQEFLDKGMGFEDLVRANVKSGWIVEAIGREDEFIRERLQQHRNPGSPIIRQHSDGKWYIIKETRTPEGGIALTFSDVTELKEKEAELGKNEALLLTVANYSPAKIHIKDVDGRYTLINRTAEKLFGVTNEEARGKDSYDLFSKDIADSFMAHDQAVIVSGESREEEEEFTMDGEVHTFLTVKFPIYDLDRVTAIGAIGTDITALKKTEAALRKSEARLLEAQSIARLGSWSRKKGCNKIYWSDETFRIFGYVPGEFEPTFDHVKKIVHPQDLKRVMGFVDRVISRKTQYDMEYRIVRSDGEIRWLHARGFSVGGGKGKSVEATGTVQDITERKHAEELVRQKTMLVELLHRIATSANEAVSVEEATQICLDEVCAYTGWPIGHVYMLDNDGTGELVPTEIWHLDHPGKFKTFHRVTLKTRFAPGIGLPGRVMSSGLPAWIADVTKDPNFRRAKIVRNIGVKAGFAFPVLVGRNVVAVLEFFSTEAVDLDQGILDIMGPIGTQLGRVMERVQAKEDLRESEERKGHILQSALEAVITIDEDGRVIEFNAAAEDMFGYAYDEVKDRDIADLIIPPEMREQHRRGLARIKKSGKSNMLGGRIELSALRAEGGEFPIKMTVTRFEMAGRSYFTAFISDLSEQKYAEKILHQSQKMEAIGHLTGGIAHDFNNLLGIVIGHLDLVQRAGIEDDHMREDIDEAQKAALRGADLTRLLLDFSRRKPKAARPADANRIIDGIKEMLVKSLTSKIDVVFNLADGLWATKIDPIEMESAILNMSINAHDAMPDGGVLTIETENKDAAEIDDLSDPKLSAGEYVVISVSDTGAGMSAELREKVFEPFFTTKELGKGTGLGLSTVYGFVKRSDGNITVHSEPGKGTRFRMYLPRSHAKKENIGPADEGDVDMPGGTETILVVDDEPKLLRSASKTLRSMGYSVYRAGDADQALETLKDKEDIDLLFSDVVMPGKMNGFELAKAALKKKPGLKVLMTSGFEQNFARKAPYFEFSKNLLTKPYRMIELATRVRATLDEGK